MKYIIVYELLFPRSNQLLCSNGLGLIDILLHILSHVVVRNVGHELILSV